MHYCTYGRCKVLHARDQVQIPPFLPDDVISLKSLSLSINSVNYWSVHPIVVVVVVDERSSRRGPINVT